MTLEKIEMNFADTMQGHELWAILPWALRERQTEYYAYLDGTRDYRAYIEAKGPFEADVNKAQSLIWVDGEIGVLRIEGIIEPKGDWFSELFGGVAALDVLTRDLNFLLESEDINAIVLDIDSPGGSVTGVFAFANMVFEARKIKPVFAFSDSVMTSAAGLIGAAAGKDNIIIADESVMTGSLAVLTEHVDKSGFEEKLGLKTTQISSGKNKILANPYEPLSKDAREELETRVKHIDNALMTAIARYRETTVEAVRAQSMQGRLFFGTQGIAAGLADEMIPSTEFIEALKAALK